MQITSGMGGAFGNVRGTLPSSVQSDIASDFTINIAYGAKALLDKWDSVPRIGNGDPSVLENWYFALWAYNGWGWVNNPNNPRFTRIGSPAENPSTFPYQERVLYMVAHPPHDSAGNPRWRPIPVTLPDPSTIGRIPHSYTPGTRHVQPLPALSAIYKTATNVAASMPVVSLPVKVENTGTLPWPSTGTTGISLTYHVMTASGDPWLPLSPFSKGMLAFAQGQTALPRDLLPGHAASMRMQVRLPPAAATYRVVWDLQQGSSTLFSAQGVLPLTTVIREAATPSDTPTALPTAAPRTVKVESVQFVRDTSVPDGTSLDAGQSFDKGWLLFNNGKLAWGDGWSLRHLSGSHFGFKTGSIAFTPACHSLNVVVTLHAPKRPGAYTGEWRVFDAAHTAVGAPLTVVVTVIGAPVIVTPSPTPVSSPSPSGHGSRTPTPTPTG